MIGSRNANLDLSYQTLYFYFYGQTEIIIILGLVMVRMLCDLNPRCSLWYDDNVAVAPILHVFESSCVNLTSGVVATADAAPVWG